MKLQKFATNHFCFKLAKVDSEIQKSTNILILNAGKVEDVPKFEIAGFGRQIFKIQFT